MAIFVGMVGFLSGLVLFISGMIDFFVVHSIVDGIVCLFLCFYTCCFAGLIISFDNARDRHDKEIEKLYEIIRYIKKETGLDISIPEEYEADEQEEWDEKDGEWVQDDDGNWEYSEKSDTKEGLKLEVKAPNGNWYRDKDGKMIFIDNTEKEGE